MDYLVLFPRECPSHRRQFMPSIHQNATRERSSYVARLVVGLLSGTLLVGCSGDVTDPSLTSVVGEWCTLRGLGANNLPAPGVSFMGVVLLQEGMALFGTGSVSRPDDDEIIPSRYSGSLSAGTVMLDRTDLEAGRPAPGPVFTLSLQLDGRDLVGTASGDPDFTGPVHLVRLGPRCFID